MDSGGLEPGLEMREELALGREKKEGKGGRRETGWNGVRSRDWTMRSRGVGLWEEF